MELAEYLDCLVSIVVDYHVGMLTKSKAEFGCLTYGTSINLGDEIQSLAAINQIKKHGGHISYYIDRDLGTILPANENDIKPPASKIICLYNCWVDGSYCKWPPGDRVIPLFISIHINEVGKDLTYQRLDQYRLEVPRSLADPSFDSYYSRFSPIYTRDEHTEQKLSSVGAKFLGCLTMTLENDMQGDRDGIYIVDVESSLYGKIPDHIIGSAQRLTHVSYTKGITQRLGEAQDLLDRYKRAKLVITSRLHCILPCLAFDTPVILMLSTWQNDPRFEGLSQLMTIYDRDEISWDHHINKSKHQFGLMATKLNLTASELLQQIELKEFAQGSNNV